MQRQNGTIANNNTMPQLMCLLFFFLWGASQNQFLSSNHVKGFWIDGGWFGCSILAILSKTYSLPWLRTKTLYNLGSYYICTRDLYFLLLLLGGVASQDTMQVMPTNINPIQSLIMAIMTWILWVSKAIVIYYCKPVNLRPDCWGAHMFTGSMVDWLTYLRIDP